MKQTNLKTRGSLIAAILLCTLILVACAAPVSPGAATTSESTAEPTTTRTRLLVAGPQLATILDAHQGWDGDRMDVEQIGQALMRIDPQSGELIPDLAESWAFSEDGKTLTIKLPADAKYSNGDPLDAQALKDAWLRYKEISPFGADLEALTDIQVVDDTTINAIFANPPAALFAVLGSVYMGPWDVAAAQAVGNEAFAIAPIASGPLTVKEYTPGSELLMARNDQYRTNLPLVQNKGPLHLQEVQMRAIPEEVTLAGELETGAVDVVMNAPASAIDRLKANPDIQLFEASLPGYTGLVMNHQRPQFADVRVRQAVAQALDRTALVKVLGSVAAPQHAFLNQAMAAYSPEMESYAQERYAYNVEAAKATLAEVGWTDSDNDGIVEKDGAPFTVELLVDANNTALQLASQVVQTQLKAIGIDAQISQQEPNAMRETMIAGDYDMGFDTIGWPDPDIFSLAFAADFWNFAKYNNPDSVEKMNVARYLLDPSERSAAYAELQKIWLEDVVEIPLWQRKYYVAARNWVKGLVVNPVTGLVYLNDVTIEE